MPENNVLNLILNHGIPLMNKIVVKSQDSLEKFFHFHDQTPYKGTLIYIALCFIFTPLKSILNIHPLLYYTLSQWAHADYSHLFSNLVILYMFGRMVELKVGTRVFFLYFFLIGVSSTVLVTFLSSPVIGASCVCMSLVTFFIINRIKLNLWNLLECAILLFIALPLISQDITQIGSHTNISHFGHLLGAFMGILLSLWYRKKS